MIDRDSFEIYYNDELVVSDIRMEFVLLLIEAMLTKYYNDDAAISIKRNKYFAEP